MAQSSVRRIRQAEARIQQLCCLGLGDQLLIPIVLEALHDIIPSHHNAFFWSDNSGQIVNVFTESPEGMDLGDLYFQKFYNRRELEVFAGWQAFIRGSNRAMDFDELLYVERRNLLNHDLYNEFLVKIGFHWGLQVAVREGDSRYGLLGLCRSRKDSPFTHEELRLLDHVNAFVAHAMIKAPEQQHSWVDGDDEGYLIVDRQGKLHWSSDQGRRFLYLAMHDRFSRSQKPRPNMPLPEPLAQLCTTLDAISHNRLCSRPPLWQQESAWGRFRFRAHWLESGAGQEPLIGITVQRQEPLSVKLVRRMQDLPLSRKQSQVCLLMAGGKSYREIAAQMNISENTAISHSRAIYDKLDARNRTELLGKLLDS